MSTNLSISFTFSKFQVLGVAENTALIHVQFLARANCHVAPGLSSTILSSLNKEASESRR